MNQPLQQAIITRYFAPTKTRMARIHAFAQSSSVFMDCQGHLDIEQNHKDAALLLAYKNNWLCTEYEIIGGFLPNGDRVFVFAK